MLERVIEERTRGNPDAAAAIRDEVNRLVGNDLAPAQTRLARGDGPENRAHGARGLEPISRGWHRTGRGDFTKTALMAAVGAGFDAGLDGPTNPTSTTLWPSPASTVQASLGCPALKSRPNIPGSGADHCPACHLLKAVRQPTDTAPNRK